MPFAINEKMFCQDAIFQVRMHLAEIEKDAIEDPEKIFNLLNQANFDEVKREVQSINTPNE